MVMSSGSVDVSAWRDTISRSFVGLDVDPQGRGDRFSGRIRGSAAGAVRADRLDVQAEPHVVRRQRHALSDGGQVLVSLQIRGVCVVSQREREAILRPQMLAIYDTTRPYELAFPEGDHEQIVVQVPRRLFTTRGLEDWLAVPVTGVEGTGHAVAALLASLPHALSRATVTQGERLVRGGLEMLVMSLEADTVQVSSTREQLFAEAMRFIEANADDPGLTPGAVANAIHASLGHLHRVFRDHDASIARTTRILRLQRCANDLTDGRLRTRSISEIAARHGFTDSAHFTRTFSARYGTPPSTWRRADRP